MGYSVEYSVTMINTYELESTHPWVTDPSSRRSGYFQAGDGLFWTIPEQTDEELEKLLGPHGWQITEWNKNGSATVIAYVGTDQGEGDDHETFCLLHELGKTQKWIREADTNLDRLRRVRATQVRELLDRGVSRYRIAGQTGIPTTVVSRIAARADEHARTEGNPA